MFSAVPEADPSLPLIYVIEPEFIENINSALAKANALIMDLVNVPTYSMERLRGYIQSKAGRKATVSKKTDAIEWATRLLQKDKEELPKDVAMEVIDGFQQSIYQRRGGALDRVRRREDIYRNKSEIGALFKQYWNEIKPKLSHYDDLSAEQKRKLREIFNSHFTFDYARKKAKTHDFETDQEAASYLGMFPVEVWINILSVNPNLSVKDIERMCRVNSVFKDLCDSGIIWKRIFMRQFKVNNAEYERIMDEGIYISPLNLLMTWRIYNENHSRHTYLTNPELGVEITIEKYNGDGDDDDNDNNNEYHVSVEGYANASDDLRENLLLILGNPHSVYNNERVWRFDPPDPFVFRAVIATALAHGLRTMWETEYVGCNVCGIEAQYACGDCQESAYCNVGCQALHWEHHKKSCAQK